MSRQRDAAIEAQVPGLRRFARALAGGDAMLADDLVQETLLRALDRWWLRRPGASLRAWLYAILWRRFIDGKRSEAVARRHAEASAEALPPLPLAAPDQALEAARVVALLARLPEEQRAVLVLVAVEGLDYAEAAAVLGIPVGTVMSRLSRGRERLRGLSGAEAAPPALRRVK
ncbi:sigma-70 family RNA polymerase sigma factor [Roseomonas eburnea]|uniref:Sigma-70 family RNA polymerase sigma factor n=1 Tax=Neoroseomonas eburnea TaxID=1346889 RepID=A0A9X9X790_9PROT|nr:sigma-70 family RNA polymerase sigma factor [Neoroseomonas eburnea]MBR0679576.1 sigma-70 family RNA polymerase sigma factor [Neoroseomonas eburnea]